MSKRAKKILRISGIVIVLLLALAIGSLHYMMSTFSDEGTLTTLQENAIPYKIKTIPYGKYVVETIRVGDPEKPKVLLIHGSPGHWYDWQFILTNSKLLEHYCIISYDRPGYGGTTIPAMGALEDQAAVAATVMRNYCANNDDCYIVAGHSYGGAVAEEVLLDYPGLVEKGVFVAGTLSPEYQKSKWYNYLAAFKPIGWLLPHDMLSSNHEMMQLSKSLADNTGLLNEIHQPIVFIQGTKDVLVPYQTAEYYESHKTDGVYYMIEEGMNHFIPWSDPQLIVEAILH